MGATNIVDRLAAVDHEFSRAEAMRALAQTNADDSEVQRLHQEIDELRRVKARDRCPRRREVRPSIDLSRFCFGFGRVRDGAGRARGGFVDLLTETEADDLIGFRRLVG
jgi:hypothetical protein